jgi:CheY-like chemotaxis protein
MAEIIYEGGQRLLETLNQLLDLSKIEADKYEITWTNIDINEIINEVSKSFLKFAEKKNLFIKLNLFPNPIILKSDERMLRGILNNLINNALKFTETGGVKISTSVKSNNVEFDRSVVIEVIDSGIGIPEDKIELIFEEFRQISEGYARDFQGTGLGLTITKKLVELLHGNISVVSSQGDGSVFRIEFPLRKETITNDENNIASAAISESNFKHDFKIICLEDDKATRRIIKNYLVDIYPTYLASTNSDFLNEISNIQYDLILLDINLGTKQSGLDILKIVKNMSTYKDTPVIALTAYAMKGDHELFLSKGFTDYLSKPFTKDQLLTLIKSYHE